MKNSKALYGLILAGGKSVRMKKDKSLLKYQGRPQVKRAFELLSGVCDQVFISNTKEQAALPAHKKYSRIPDLKKYSGVGPLAGILSAMEKYPKADWLVLACDLPYVNSKTLERLFAGRNRRRIATAYISTSDKLPEPLCAVYESKARKQLLKFLKKGVHCPRRIMINSKVQLLKQKDKWALENVNTPEEYRAAVQRLGK